MITSSAPLDSIPYAAMPQISSGEKTYLPVANNQLVYAHFEHVAGVPAESNQKGVSVSELQILNSLIRRLVSLQEEKDFLPLKKEDLSTAQMDKMLEFFHTQITQIEAKNKNIPYAHHSSIKSALFSINI